MGCRHSIGAARWFTVQKTMLDRRDHQITDVFGVTSIDACNVLHGLICFDMMKISGLLTRVRGVSREVLLRVPAFSARRLLRFSGRFAER